MEHYIKPAFEEQHKDDGLTIMGHGLGVNILFAKFVQHYSKPNAERQIVICLNATGHESALTDILLSESANPNELPKVITNEVSSQEKCDMYAEGGCLFITSRILIVDLLDNKVDPKRIAGLLVYNAHRISETSIESFVVRVYREKNRDGFIKAFSEDPEHLQNSFGKLERQMKLLYVKKLYLWPRFRQEVDAVLERNQPQVVELSLPLTPAMKAIQSALLVAINTCLQELKRSTPQLDSTDSDSPLMTLENSLFQSFDTVIRNQLDADWHRVSYKAKQLVADLSTLRKLLDYLIRYDAFSFYYLLLKLQAASSEQISPSLWLVSEAANHIFRLAKERVFRIVPLGKALSNKSSSAAAQQLKEQMTKTLKLQQELSPTLECPPKWRLLTEILKEVRADYRADDTREHAGRVLLVVKDDLAASQLRDIIVNGEKHVIDSRFRWFVSQQTQDIRKSVASKARVYVGGASKFQSGTSSEQLHRADLQVQEAMGGAATDLLLSESLDDTSFMDSSGQLAVPLKDMQNLSAENKLLVLQEKLLRLTPAVASRQHDSCTTESLLDSMRGVDDSEAVVVNEEEDMPLGKKRAVSGGGLSEDSRKRRKGVEADSGRSSAAQGDPKDGSLSQDSGDEVQVTLLDPALHLVVVTHAQMAERFTLLSDMRPSCVILYDPEISVIRAVEVHQASSELPLKLYFLLYEGSAEEHRYVGALAKEKKCFEALIAAKEHLVVSLPDNPEDLEQELLNDQALAGDTRVMYKSGSNGREKEPRKIVVDVREFRSSLPSTLHYSRFAVIPRTIAVADYILSPEICVERKGISDLFQSFASGRLYNQAEAMTKYYKFPCLLVEFSADKAFSLMAVSEITPDIQQNCIISRIALLAMSFPSLKILWSRSASATAGIFQLLVTNHDPVDVAKAVSVGAVAGADDSNQGLEDSSAEAQAMAAAHEILLSLPGITVHNYREVMNSVENLSELAKMSESQLTPLIGPVNAKKLYTFFKQRRLV